MAPTKKSPDTSKNATLPCDASKESARGLNDSQKLEKVLQLLREYRWSPGDFMKHYCTTDLEGAYNTQLRTKKMWNWVFLDKKLGFNQVLLKCKEDLGDLHFQPLQEKVASEIEELVNGQLGNFSVETPIEGLQLHTIKNWVRNTAPYLWDFLHGLVHQRNYLPIRDIDFSTRLVSICAILCFTRAPRKGSFLPSALGLYFHSMGVKRRVITLLHRLGITVSYKVVRSLYSTLVPHCQVSRVP